MIKNKRRVFFIQQHERFIYIIFFLQSHSSLHVKNTTIVSFFWGFFTLMGILIVFMSNITPQIFYQ